ncbi:MAG: hypothetical protein Q4D38_14690 [Planctomycetia bacterium]|nr:hypothetical protein [Planctomycetia bacterium]
MIESKKTMDERNPVTVPEAVWREVREMFHLMEERTTNAAQRFGKRKTPGAEPLEALFRNLVVPTVREA